MNNYRRYTVMVLLSALLLFPGCEKEDILQPKACFSSDVFEANVGEAVTFTNCSEGMAFSIWYGDQFHAYSNFGSDAGVALSDNFISYAYPEPGTFTVAMVATSYGNNGEDVFEDVDSLVISITDARAELIEFGFRSPKVVGIISGQSISTEVPFGTSMEALKPTFKTTSKFAVVTVDGTVLSSGKTAVDFTEPVEVVVTAQTGATSTYTSTVFSNPETGKEILAFMINGVPGVFDGNTITVTLPAGTSDFTQLKADFETSSEKATVTVDGAVQVSGSTRNDFTNPIEYVVTAEDESISTYTVTVEEEIGFTSFGFEQLVPPVYATISGYDLNLQVLSGTPVDSLYASFETTDHNPTVKIEGVLQTSSITLNNFSAPVTYTLETDGKSVDYTVRVGLIK